MMKWVFYHHFFAAGHLHKKLAKYLMLFLFFLQFSPSWWQCQWLGLEHWTMGCWDKWSTPMPLLLAIFLKYFLNCQILFFYFLNIHSFLVASGGGLTQTLNHGIKRRVFYHHATPIGNIHKMLSETPTYFLSFSCHSLLPGASSGGWTQTLNHGIKRWCYAIILLLQAIYIKPLLKLQYPFYLLSIFSL